MYRLEGDGICRQGQRTLAERQLGQVRFDRWYGQLVELMRGYPSDRLIEGDDGHVGKYLDQLITSDASQYTWIKVRDMVIVVSAWGSFQEALPCLAHRFVILFAEPLVCL